jgi:hypothetical protein
MALHYFENCFRQRYECNLLDLWRKIIITARTRQGKKRYSI